jgi:UDP-glucose 4-epimerase
MTFANKKLMITGGTGSFGKTVLSRFIETDIEKIVVFSRDEKKQEDLRLSLRNPKVSFVLGDVRDFDSINDAMRGIDFIFHAAALKQVPSCEFYPMEAVRTNVLGTDNTLRAAARNGASKLVLLSTDKAVYPINAMGTSKAMAEKIMIAMARSLEPSDCIMSATRYGNVMASRGSVIPLFISSIKNGTPLRVTDPNMTRFMMSLEESVDLVINAFNNAEQGDIFVQQAPACSLRTLYEALQELFKQRAKIEIIGTRHGEKLFETLISREEMIKAKEMGRYFRIPADNRDLNYELFISEGQPTANDAVDYTSHNTNQLDLDATISLLQTLPYVQNELDSWKPRVKQQ